VFSTVTSTPATDTENLNLIGPGNLPAPATRWTNGCGNAWTTSHRPRRTTPAGGGGNDTMNGGDGDDTYIVGSIGDIVADSPASISWSAISGPSLQPATGVKT
jgi:Ca2+-binding RTX toxin-like protein